MTDYPDQPFGPLDLPFDDANNLVCRDFERAWRAGQLPRIEDYVERAVSHARSGLLKELIALEIELRESQVRQPKSPSGQVDRDSYIRRFPLHPNAVRAAFDLVDQRQTAIPEPASGHPANTQPS